MVMRRPGEAMQTGNFNKESLVISAIHHKTSEIDCAP